MLLFDCHLTHLAPPVLRAVGAAGIWVLPLPAKMTWLMQPLDTHVFAAYKASIRRRYVQHLADDATGRVSTAKVLEIALAAAAEVLPAFAVNGLAFAHNGFGSQQRLLRRSLLLHLGKEEVAPPRAGLPTLPELQAYLGVRTTVDLNALFSGICCRPARPLVVVMMRRRLLAKSNWTVARPLAMVMMRRRIPCIQHPQDPATQSHHSSNWERCSSQRGREV